MHPLRREILGFIGTAALLTSRGGLGQAFGASSLSRLRDVAAERGICYGATPDTDLARAPPGFAEMFAQQCRVLAPALAWSSTTSPGIYNFSWWKGNVSFARAHGLKLTGSHLLWHEWLPAWFKAIPGRSEAERAVVDHIRAMGSRFAGQVYSWNVVNEAIDVRDGRPDGLRASPLLEKLGPAYIDLAFRVAREADPTALLLYNDHNLYAARPEHEDRRRALLQLLDTLKRNGAPIDGVGLQSHLRLLDPFDENRYRSFLREIADRSLKILVTELDVLDIGAPADVPARDRMVADLYTRFLSVALENRAVVAVVTWGLSDRYSWLSRFKRPDRLPARPLPFDVDFQPKPAFYALLRALENAPPRGN